MHLHLHLHHNPFQTPRCLCLSWLQCRDTFLAHKQGTSKHRHSSATSLAAPVTNSSCGTPSKAHLNPHSSRRAATRARDRTRGKSGSICRPEPDHPAVFVLFCMYGHHITVTKSYFSMYGTKLKVKNIYKFFDAACAAVGTIVWPQCHNQLVDGRGCTQGLEWHLRKRSPMTPKERKKKNQNNTKLVSQFLDTTATPNTKQNKTKNAIQYRHAIPTPTQVLLAPVHIQTPNEPPAQHLHCLGLHPHPRHHSLRRRGLQEASANVVLEDACPCPPAVPLCSA